MVLRTYINYRYFDLPPGRAQISVPVLDERNTSLPWLGCIDRNAARRIHGAQQVPLGIVGWKPSEMDSWTWVQDNYIVVGCEIEEGVMCVTDGSTPLIKWRLSEHS